MCALQCFGFFLQIICTLIRSLYYDAGELNCKKKDVVIGSEGDEQGTIPENHSHCLEVSAEKAPSPACRVLKNNNK